MQRVLILFVLLLLVFPPLAWGCNTEVNEGACVSVGYAEQRLTAFAASDFEGGTAPLLRGPVAALRFSNSRGHAWRLEAARGEGVRTNAPYTAVAEKKLLLLSHYWYLGGKSLRVSLGAGGGIFRYANESSWNSSTLSRDDGNETVVTYGMRMHWRLNDHWQLNAMAEAARMVAFESWLDDRMEVLLQFSPTTDSSVSIGYSKDGWSKGATVSYGIGF